MEGVTRHGWRQLNVIDWTADEGSTVYPAGAFHGTRFTDRDRCGCHTQLCTRVATQEDLLCDECRGHPECQSLPLDSR